ncbi:MAG: GTPase Era [Oscillibacter sp.]|nr:GTPase Era [Oscillibacter sp.]
MSEIRKTAMVTVCGRPNVGKSSLTNALVGEKIAIVSNKAQTTRNRVCGVLARGDTQIVLLDTPGLHRPRSALGEYMVKVVRESLEGVDCALLLVEPIAHVGGPEEALIARIREEGIPAILCVNKIDTVEKASLLPVMAAYNEAWDGFKAILPISARTGEGLDELCDEIRKYAEEGPQLFPDGQTSDQPERQVMGELLREKLLLCLDKEIPHGVAVEISRFSEREESGIVDVDAVIYCEKGSHKGIIIGKHGDMLKKVSSLARRDMEKFMGTKVYLQTWVKVKENWRDSVSAVRSFGYRDSD